MRALRLDYRGDNGLRNLLGYALLAVVLGVAGVVGWQFSQVRQETAHLEALLEKIQARTHGPMTSAEVSQLPPEKLAEVIKFSNQVIHQLNLPWDTLFTQLEKARSDTVALLGIEPDANSSAIKIAGEAKNYAAMIDYVRSLSEQGVLQGVYLADHKMDDLNPDKPIRFTLEASWAAK